MSIRRGKRPVLLLVFPVLLLAVSAISQERILSYDSDIQIAADASMVVTETIRVRAEGQNIRRGIYRDFPTRYTDRFGNSYRVDFEVIDVTRDSEAEPWRSENLSNGVRVYVGDADVLLAPGEYSYLIRYRTTRQIGFFDDHDELYWNVTGNGWVFQIDRVRATVSLPGEVPAMDISMEGYTGRAGANGQAYAVRVMDGGASIETTGVLLSRSGLTLVMSFPKGIVSQPGSMQRFNYLLTDNAGLLLGLMTLIAVFLYLYKAWSSVGRDPKAGVIFPHYEPPRGYSPASARYIFQMGYDKEALTAAIVNLAVNGHLIISKDDDDYVLKKTASEKTLAPGEQVLLAKLFASGTELELDTANRAILISAREAHRKALRRDYLNIYFAKNTWLLLPSVVGTIAMLVVIVLTDSLVPWVVLPFGLIVLLHLLFAYLLKAPSKKGRLLMDKLEGFKLYLEVAEKDDLNLRHPPELTPELFERYLPFAIALGVEQDWAKRFAAVFAALQTSNTPGYHPAWYAGHFSVMHLNTFTTDVGSGFNTAIASAATPPGGTSGAGGGGFSGGGGGGGGGGGW